MRRDIPIEIEGSMPAAFARVGRTYRHRWTGREYHVRAASGDNVTLVELGHGGERGHRETHWHDLLEMVCVKW